MCAQARWTLKARVAQKSDLRRYSNARGEGRFFSFDLIDAQGGEIRCTAFNDTCDKFYERVQEGKVYMLSKASVRPKKPGSVGNSGACCWFCHAISVHGTCNASVCIHTSACEQACRHILHGSTTSLHFRSMCIYCQWGWLWSLFLQVLGHDSMMTIQGLQPISDHL